MTAPLRRLRVLPLLALACALQAPAGAQPRLLPPEDRAAVDASLESLWALGERAYRDGDVDAAGRLFEQALARDDRQARSWNYLGGVDFARGDLARAREHFRRARELDPRDVRACNNLATVHERLGDFAVAEELYLQASRVDPAHPETHRNLGVLYARRLGRPEAARRAWTRFLELVPAGDAAAAVRRELDALPPPPAGGAANAAP